MSGNNSGGCFVGSMKLIITVIFIVWMIVTLIKGCFV